MTKTLGKTKHLLVPENTCSNKTLSSMYEKRKKDNVSAVYMYKRIVKDHPQTAAAREAEQALARLEPTLAGGAAK